MRYPPGAEGDVAQRRNLLTRLSARWMPAAVLVGLVAWTLIGPYGLRDAYALSRRADEARDRWAGLERENTRLLLEIQKLDADPVNLERAAADELRLVRPGTRLYAFDGSVAVVASDTVVAPAAEGAAAPSIAEPAGPLD